MILLNDHEEKNQVAWTKMSVDYVEPADRAWSKASIEWGIWGIPESTLNAFEGVGDLEGKDSIELGCGTAYFSAWLARAGAHPVGIDITPAQLATARAMQSKYGIEFPLIEGSAETVPWPDESFDLAISEYGASIWCDPYKWIPEAARLLRPGGVLIFLRNSTISMLCSSETGPVTDRLSRDYSSLNRIEWPDDGSVEFQLPTGPMIKLLRDSGFEIEALIEILAPEDAPPTRFEYMPQEWARRWPNEEIWRVRKKSG